MQASCSLTNAPRKLSRLQGRDTFRTPCQPALNTALVPASCRTVPQRPVRPHSARDPTRGRTSIRVHAAKVHPKHSFQLNKLFVPDISPEAEANVPASVLAKIRAEALAMPLWQLGLRTALEVGMQLVLWQIARSVIRGLSNRGQQAIKQQIERGDMNFSVVRVVTDAAAVAVQRPARLFLPIVTVSNVLRTITLASQIVAESELLKQLPWLAKSVAGNLTRALGMLDATLLDLSEVGLIIFLCWFFLAWKEELSEVAYLMERKLVERGQSDGGLERAVRPFSSLLGWAIIAVGGLSILHVMHVNIQPLLAVGGVGGLAVGFGAQVVTANAVAGITLFVTRPFVVGDRITLKSSGGSPVLSGVVESISPMRTVIRTDDNVPEAIPNKAIIDLIVSNDSKTQKPSQRSGSTFAKDPRRYRHTFKLSATDKFDAVKADLQTFLEQHPEVDRSHPASVEITNFTGSSFDVSAEAHTTATQTRDFNAFHSGVLSQLAHIFQRHQVTG